MGWCQRLVRGDTEQARMKEKCKRCGKTLALDFAVSIHCIVGPEGGPNYNHSFQGWLPLLVRSKESPEIDTVGNSGGIWFCVLSCSHQFVRFSLSTANNNVMTMRYTVPARSPKRYLQGSSMGNGRCVLHGSKNGGRLDACMQPSITLKLVKLSECRGCQSAINDRGYTRGPTLVPARRLAATDNMLGCSVCHSVRGSHGLVEISTRDQI